MLALALGRRLQRQLTFGLRELEVQRLDRIREARALGDEWVRERKRTTKALLACFCRSEQEVWDSLSSIWSFFTSLSR